MHLDRFQQFFEDLPSGSESEDSMEGLSEPDFENDLMDVDFLDEPTEFQEEGWDSEDELPLSVIQHRERAKTTVWTSSSARTLGDILEFTEETGPNIPEDVETPTEVFLRIFPLELIEEITFQTNLFAMQKGGGSTNFVRTTTEEMKVFLALNLLMGIKKQPSYRDYWSSMPELRDHYISSKMSRDRFAWHLGNIHLNDNSQQPDRASANFDKLYKVRPLIKKLGETFMSSYKPSKCQAIDESMVKFKGRSSLRQYMPMKPVKRGYKVWIRANESGYVSQFQIYTGKINASPEGNLGSRVVKDLSRTLVGKGFNLYFDNFFNSVQLQKDLQSEKIYSCGTFRKGRKGMPQDLLEDKNLQQGQFDWRVSNDGLAFMKWKDKRSVLLLSNFHDPTVLQTAKRKQKDGSIKEIICPKLVCDYNQNMGFVDKADMLKSIYEIDRKSKKWWHRIFWYLLDLSLLNAFIIFSQRIEANSMSLKIFRVHVCSGLIGSKKLQMLKGKAGPSSPQQTYKAEVSYERRFDQCQHMPRYGNSRRCGHCSSKAEPHRTKWSCTVCEVGLCLSDKKNCFAEYHTLQ